MPISERDKLVGKEYAGIVTIQFVRVSPDGGAIIEAKTQPESAKARVRVRFVTTSTDTVLNSLSRGQVIRVRARLSAFFGTSTAPILNFSEMTIHPGG